MSKIIRSTTATFEGTIPEGEYGGGTVMLWDRGRWEPEGDPHKGYAKGRLTFRLDGEKLNGTWHLVRMAKRPRERQESWLLIKADDAYARTAGRAGYPRRGALSVKTGRSLEEIAPKRTAKSPAKRKAPAKKAASEKSEKSSKRFLRSRKQTDDSAAEVAGVALTHPDRVLWEEQGLTKQELAEFYVGIADWVLPHLVDRPLTLVRCPSGAEKGCFVQQHSWAGISPIHPARIMCATGRARRRCCSSRDIQGVVALVQAGVLEMHVWGATDRRSRAAGPPRSSISIPAKAWHGRR